MKYIRQLSMMAALLACTAIAWAQPAWVDEALPGAQKSGQGRLTWLGLKVYDADLWVAKNFNPAQYAQAGMLLQLTYLRSFNGADIAKRSKNEIAKLNLGTAQQRLQWYEEMKRVFPNVNAGDALAGLHQPGRGAQFFLNGKALGEIADAQFADAFFAIWLDANTTAPALRQQLLSAQKKDAGE